MNSELFDFTDKTIKVRDYYIKNVPRQSVRNFIEKWHYSKSINGMKSSYCFVLYRENEMIGAMTDVFGYRWRTGTKYIDEAVADSLGVFHVASEESVIFKMMKR